jgi:N-acetylglucosamine malate deacetylase 1
VKLDILAFGAHPDDVELACSGTLVMHKRAGYKIGIVDLTRGELGTRGTPEIRDEESRKAAKILDVDAREQLGFRDGFFTNDADHQLKVIRMIRKYKPEIVLANAVHDRHPDHGKGSRVVSDACFYAGLRKIESLDDAGQPQEAWRPKAIYHYIQFLPLEPYFIVDVSDAFEKKMESIRAYSSQFYDPSSKEPATIISSEHFLKNVEERASDLGRMIGVRYGEAFMVERLPGLKDLFDLL